MAVDDHRPGKVSNVEANEGRGGGVEGDSVAPVAGTEENAVGNSVRVCELEVVDVLMVGVLRVGAGRARLRLPARQTPLGNTSHLHAVCRLCGYDSICEQIGTLWRKI